MIVATLASDQERQLIEQIIARLNVGAPNRVLYQGDGGIFAWFEEAGQPVGNHLEALYALFRNPARVAGLSIDLSISFGVELGSGRSLASRAALGAASCIRLHHSGPGRSPRHHAPAALQVVGCC